MNTELEYIQLQKEAEQQAQAELKALREKYQRKVEEAKKKMVEKKQQIAKDYAAAVSTPVSEHIFIVRRSSVSDWGQAFGILTTMSKVGEEPKRNWNPKF